MLKEVSKSKPEMANWRCYFFNFFAENWKLFSKV